MAKTSEKQETGEKKERKAPVYKCQECGETFTGARSLGKHREVVHKIAPVGKDKGKAKAEATASPVSPTDLLKQAIAGYKAEKQAKEKQLANVEQIEAEIEFLGATIATLEGMLKEQQEQQEQPKQPKQQEQPTA